MSERAIYENGRSDTISSSPLTAWALEIGKDFVSVDPAVLSDAEQATFPCDHRIKAILQPGSTQEVQACIQIARQFSVPLSPISRGCNWGFGSKVPASSGCVLLDLGRMNKIIEFNDELGYVTVQPGVSFQKVAEYQQQHAASHFLSIIGGPPQASVIGNYVERGTSLGPYGERAQNACNAEVVLGRGDIIRTGFGQFEGGERLAPLHRWGVGPSLDGLFGQSNFGVITELTFWLNKKPNYFQSFFATITSETDLDALLPHWQDLQSQGTIQPYCTFFWNAEKFAAAKWKHPDPTAHGFDIHGFFEKQGRSLEGVRWVLVGGLSASSRSLGRSQRNEVLQVLKGRCKTKFFVDSQKARWLGRVARTLKAAGLPAMGIDDDTLEAMIDKSILLGHPTVKAIRSLYWRKEMPIPSEIDPHRDACGLHWMCHEIPYRQQDVRVAIDLVTETIQSHGFEANVAVVPCSTRCMRMLVALIYDREQAGADSRASGCMEQVNHRLHTNGYLAFRLGIASMQHKAKRTEANQRLVDDLKLLFDPDRIISPGRYE